VKAVLLAILMVSAGATWIVPVATATAVVALISSVLLVVSVLSVSWQTYAWRTPDTFRRTGLAHLDEPELSFSVLVPARHEEAVLGATLAGIAAIDHPNFEVIVVVGHDDPGTRAVAEAAAADLGVPVKIVTDWHEHKNKPKALNNGLAHCTGDVVMVIDAEDDVQPGLLRLTDTAFRRHAADIVQTGVQLVDFDKSWWTARNVLEYFFWFRSRLHFHAAQRFITLGGTSVAIRRDLLEHLGGWDETCLAEDCDLGVRASSIGARVTVVYEPGHTTLEETPPDVWAFFRQRVRWMQGFIQVLAKGDWRRLPTRRQRVQAAIVLATPVSQSFAAVAAPVSALTALLLEAPVLIVLFTFLPLVTTAIGLAFDLVGLTDFGRTFSRRIGWRAYLTVILSLPAYQLLLSSAAFWAAVRHARGLNNWHKTAHVNAHRDVVIDLRESPA
jgi:cellulose synthase/poly-beta-1,6-N-acetylglucosamine synthase-like glycosyltransferase